MKRLCVLVGVMLFFGVAHNADALIIENTQDAYIDDFTYLENVDPDGIPDRISNTNGILAGQGKIFDFQNSYNVVTKSVITFDLQPYQAQSFASAYLTGFGYATPSKFGSGNAIQGMFYSYAGNGLVELNDFNAQANFAGSYLFERREKNFRNLETDIVNFPFSVDMTDPLNTLLSENTSFAEFRLEADDFEIAIPSRDGDWQGLMEYELIYGPRLEVVLSGDDVPNAAVPEPATLGLFVAGLCAAVWRRRSSCFSFN